jgi:hypothetical protein
MTAVEGNSKWIDSKKSAQFSDQGLHAAGVCCWTGLAAGGYVPGRMHFLMKFFRFW